MPLCRTFRALAFGTVACSLLATAPARAGDPEATTPSVASIVEDADLLRAMTDPPREPTPPMIRRSVELYNEGVVHGQAGRLKDAYRAFRDAYEQDGSVESLANAAVIEASLGRPRSAAEHLARAIKRLPPGKTAEAEVLGKRLEQVTREIGAIEIRAPEMSNVELDDHWVGTGAFTRTFYVEPGVHQVVVSARGGSVARLLILKKGDKEVVEATDAQLDASAAAAVRAASSLTAPSLLPVTRASSNTPWILGGTALALAATGGAGLGVYMRGHDERVKIEIQTRAIGGRCGPPPTVGFVDDCHARDQEAFNETVGMVIAIAGLGGLGALGSGVLLVVLTEPTPGAAPVAAAAKTGTFPRVAIGLGPASVVLHGNF